VYLNCEDFKRHSFPNVLIEILDALFGELEGHLSGWFGRKKRSRDLLKNIRMQLSELKAADEVVDAAIKTVSSVEGSRDISTKVALPNAKIAVNSGIGFARKHRDELERTFQSRREKIAELDNWLPQLKRQVREFFDISNAVTAVYQQIDDLYHLRREDQPFVVDYVHRLCKDVPLFFKIATLRHASVLFVSREKQPIGAQERQDFQPLNIDYTFTDFRKTREQNKLILREFGKLAGFSATEVDGLFKGTGFDRLVLAGGGVPRDTLSLFLAVLSDVQSNTDKRIGKDDVRILSKVNFERRIEELKQDSGEGEQEALIKAIYVIRGFCLEKQTNVFLVAERTLQQDDEFRSLIYKLLDYRIIHSGATALTHKSRREGTYQAFAIDIGCYAHLRKLEGRFKEMDLSAADAKERLRSAPLLELGAFNAGFSSAPADAEEKLTADEG
jgi:hypothetical protein